MIEERLKLYRQNKADVETTIARCQVWEDMINNNEVDHLVYTPSSTLGMPPVPFKIHSTVESEVIKKEITIEDVRAWIGQDMSRIFFKKLEIEQIEGALKALTKEQRFVIESKYFDDLFWKNIEISFNERFVNRSPITDIQLKRINRDSLKLLADILTPFYDRYYIENEK